MNRLQRYYSLIFTLLVFILFSCSTKETEAFETSEVKPNTYDSLLATKLGADMFGMRKYVFAYLKEGPNRDQDSLEAVRIQRAHLDNIKRMASEGKLVVAGPFMDNHEVKGVYIFAVETVEEAEQLTNTDPAIQSGRLIMELHPWYGSAAMMQINDIHPRIAKEGI